MSSEIWSDLTVVIPVHNDETGVQQAVRTVRGQAVAPAEIIVIDDGSTDDSASRARAAGARVVGRPEAGGAGVARNAGLAQATTRFVAFLDSDDEWLEDHLRAIRRDVSGRPDTTLFASGGFQVGPDREPLGTLGQPARSFSPIDLLLRSVVVTTSAAVVDRGAAQDVGGFDEREELRPASCEDLALWLKLTQTTPGWVTGQRTVRYTVSDDRRPAHRLAQNELGRVVITREALARVGAPSDLQRRVWQATWLDLGKWHLKHGTPRSAVRCFFRAIRKGPAPVPLAWVGVALLPRPAQSLLRSLARKLRTRLPIGGRPSS